MPIRHAVLRFDPSGNPVVGGDAGTLHIPIDKSKNFGNNSIRIHSLKSSVRVLQSEFPTVTPIMGFFLSKGIIADINSQVFPLWNNAATFYQPDCFYHHIFFKEPDNADPLYYGDGYLVEYGESLIASLTIDNIDTVNPFNKVIRIHLTFAYSIGGF